jgi:hypothetical protein
MRIWMLASLLYAVAAAGGDRGMERSSQLFDRVIASHRDSIHSVSFSSPSDLLAAGSIIAIGIRRIKNGTSKWKLRCLLCCRAVQC